MRKRDLEDMIEPRRKGARKKTPKVNEALKRVAEAEMAGMTPWLFGYKMHRFALLQQLGREKYAKLLLKERDRNGVALPVLWQENISPLLDDRMSTPRRRPSQARVMDYCELRFVFELLEQAVWRETKQSYFELVQTNRQARSYAMDRHEFRAEQARDVRDVLQAAGQRVFRGAHGFRRKDVDAVMAPEYQQQVTLHLDGIGEVTLSGRSDLLFGRETVHNVDWKLSKKRLQGSIRQNRLYGLLLEEIFRQEKERLERMYLHLVSARKGYPPSLLTMPKTSYMIHIIKREMQYSDDRVFALELWTPQLREEAQKDLERMVMLPRNPRACEPPAKDAKELIEHCDTAWGGCPQRKDCPTYKTYKPLPLV